MDATARPFAIILLFTGAVGLHGADRITRPFELVPLWSEEMIGHLTGSTQPSCSGPNAGTCERLNTGTCDGTTYFTLPPYNPDLSPKAPCHAPAKQTNSANPQFFGILVGNASSSDHAHHIVDDNFQTIDLLFDCQYSGNDACPTSRFHVGAVQAVEIGLASGEKTVNLTPSATVLPEGKSPWRSTAHSGVRCLPIHGPCTRSGPLWNVSQWLDGLFIRSRALRPVCLRPTVCKQWQ